MRLPSRECLSSSILEHIGKENVQPEPGPADNSANLLWLLDFRLDNIIPNDGNNPDKRNMEVNSRELASHPVAAAAAAAAAVPCKPAVKPPYTYTELIEQALSEKGPLTVAEIYRWISERFPYFKANDDRWKNSVRHNLSISPHFRKSVKARTGTGHLWTLALPPSARTIAANMAQKAKDSSIEELQDEAARACLELLRSEDFSHNNETANDRPCSPLSFERAAELMLSSADNIHGHDRVHVEFLARPLIQSHDDSASPEFLNPIPRDELMVESGLFTLPDPFSQITVEQHDQCHIQVHNEQMQTDVGFDPFAAAEPDASSMLFGDEYPLSYSYEIL